MRRLAGRVRQEAAGGGTGTCGRPLPGVTAGAERTHHSSGSAIN